MWERFDTIIPVSASILIVILLTIVVIQAFMLASSWTPVLPQPSVVIRPQTSVELVPLNSESSEGTFVTKSKPEEL